MCYVIFTCALICERLRPELLIFCWSELRGRCLQWQYRPNTRLLSCLYSNCKLCRDCAVHQWAAPLSNVHRHLLQSCHLHAPCLLPSQWRSADLRNGHSQRWLCVGDLLRFRQCNAAITVLCPRAVSSLFRLSLTVNYYLFLCYYVS